MNKLASYLDHTRQTPTAFSRKLGVSHAAVLRYIAGTRTPRPKIMAAIERETGGLITAHDWLAAAQERMAA